MGEKIYSFARFIFKVIVKTFFREIKVIGANNIRRGRPTLIVGIHRNQFVDGIMIVSCLENLVNFIVAAKSMRRPIIGHGAKAVGGIPVERPQDLAKPGKGIILCYEKGNLIGKETKFLEELKVGDFILVQNYNEELAIKEIINNEVISVSGFPSPEHTIINGKFKIIPKIDQSSLFENVWEALKQNKCIGIFPEGGSHDRTDFLPLKAGFCIMALGAMLKYGIEVDIIPCGLNYFKGHQFRSKVVVEFGTPYTVSNELLEIYKINKKEAISKLLLEVENKLREVTITAPSYGVLMSLYLIKNIYKPDKKVLTADQEMLLNRRFQKGYEKKKDDPQVKEFLEEINKYRSRLKNVGIEDYQVKSYSPKFMSQLMSIGYSFLRCILSMSFAVPGLLLSGPFALIISYLGERERKKALAGSKVKILGKDVVASYKIVCAIVMFPIYACLFTTIYYFLVKHYITKNGFFQILLTTSFGVLWPIYAYTMIRSVDGVVRHFRTLKAKLLFLFDESKYSQLRFFRKTMQTKIRDLVNKFGPEIFGSDFDKIRVIKQIDFLSERKKSAQIRSIFQTLEEVGI